ncbi:THUMP domain-containing protein [Methanotorris igneus]|uniref:THUMP domain-containing protein n=1 Tax=Methanotorris igneus (strain DSM 5666 / JCM 11834 / Kol 5) TaxID=880724 RepID=F6BAL3_METIK|nr:THUMP domain-containing protein [Methanotorris igneus]AEF97026.1 THUMP domain-containing protein [Methanotorris igneus Kol 5]
MKPTLLVTTQPGFEGYLKEELKTLSIKKIIKYTMFRGLLKVLSESPYETIEAIKKEKDKFKFLMRAVPLEVECPSDLESIKENTIFLLKRKLLKNKLITGKSFVVRCNRRGKHKYTSEEVERFIGKEVLKSFDLKVDLKNYDFKINIEILQDTAYISIFDDNFNEFRHEENIKKSKYLKRYIERPLNRSERKMRELVERYPNIFDVDVVIDIGSAPGGWAKVLAENAKVVYAIDTGELKIKKDNIIHIKKRAEDVEDLPQCQLLTNDTNLYPEESALLTVKLSKFLEENGYIIHTIKSENKYNVKEDIDKVKKIFENANIKILKIMNLRANTKNEVTLMCQKRA